MNMLSMNMLNSKWMMWLLCFFLMACQRQEKTTLLHKSLEKKSTPHSELVRKIANDPTNLCLRDVFGLQMLKQEVKEAEEKLSGDPVRGRWKHLDLSKLPTPAANFVQEYGDMLGDQSSNSIDYSGCEDVPCLYNRIYGKADHIAGYVHYLWYLRMGSMLSADNKSPMQNSPNAGVYNGKKIPLSNYLYNDQELYALWRLTLMLNAPHTTLINLKEVQRLPRGENPEAPYNNSCGVAHSSGFIVLADGCLEAYNDQAYLFTAVTHELSHALDFEEGMMKYGELYRSLQPEYLDLIGFKLEEYKDQNGQIVRNWKPTAKTKLITDYSGKNPAENFAELLAHYRMRGDTIKIKADPLHYRFAQQGYYQEREFLKETLQEDWTTDIVNRSLKDILATIVTCQNNKTQVPCQNQEMGKLIKEMTAKIKIKEPEACRVLGTSPGYKWNNLLGSKITAAQKKFSTLSSSPKALKNLTENFDEIFLPQIAYTAYLNCETKANDCYQQEIRQHFSELKSLESTEKESISSAYLASYPYTNIDGEVKVFYRMLVNSYQGAIKKQVNQVWKLCAQNISDTESPRTGPFTLTEGYMVSSVYNCINERYDDAIEEVLNGMRFQGLSVNDDREKTQIFTILKAKTLEAFRDKHKATRREEERNAEAFAKVRREQAISTLLNNRYWVKRNKDPAVLKVLCQDAALALVGNPVICQQKKDLYRKFAEELVCAEVLRQL